MKYYNMSNKPKPKLMEMNTNNQKNSAKLFQNLKNNQLIGPKYQKLCPVAKRFSKKKQTKKMNNIKLLLTKTLKQN